MERDLKEGIAVSLKTALELRRITCSLKAAVDLILDGIDDENQRAIALIFHPGVHFLSRIMDDNGFPGLGEDVDGCSAAGATEP